MATYSYRCSCGWSGDRLGVHIEDMTNQVCEHCGAQLEHIPFPSEGMPNLDSKGSYQPMFRVNGSKEWIPGHINSLARGKRSKFYRP